MQAMLSLNEKMVLTAILRHGKPASLDDIARLSTLGPSAERVVGDLVELGFLQFGKIEEQAARRVSELATQRVYMFTLRGHQACESLFKLPGEK
jgi:hypothetical protein